MLHAVDGRLTQHDLSDLRHGDCERGVGHRVPLTAQPSPAIGGPHVAQPAPRGCHTSLPSWAFQPARRRGQDAHAGSPCGKEHVRHAAGTQGKYVNGS